MSHELENKQCWADELNPYYMDNAHICRMNEQLIRERQVGFSTAQAIRDADAALRKYSYLPNSGRW